MKIQILGAFIIDQQSPFHLKKKNIFIDEGKIKAIDDVSYPADKTINAEGMKISPGWFDMQAHFCDPGYEWKEDIASGTQTATAGGFTGVALCPNTNPIVQDKSTVFYLKNHPYQKITQTYPIAALTKDMQGTMLNAMMDLYTMGAVAFTDGDQEKINAKMLSHALQYLQPWNGLLIQKPQNISMAYGGMMHEGIQSTKLGIQSISGIAEFLSVQKSLAILAHVGGRLHLACVSDPKAIALISQAKKKGLQVSCSMAVYQPLFTDAHINNFDTNYKVDPPFRTIEDNQMLIKGLQENIIDVIVTNHRPQDQNNKNNTFDQADFGMIGLQTCLHFLIALSSYIPWEQLIDKITTQPRSLLKLPSACINLHAKANLTLFDIHRTWILDHKTNLSKSINTLLYQKRINGKVMAVIHEDYAYFDEELS